VKVTIDLSEIKSRILSPFHSLPLIFSAKWWTIEKHKRLNRGIVASAFAEMAFLILASNHRQVPIGTDKHRARVIQTASVAPARPKAVMAAKTKKSFRSRQVSKNGHSKIAAQNKLKPTILGKPFPSKTASSRNVAGLATELPAKKVTAQ
jgi:hypothetical protein